MEMHWDFEEGKYRKYQQTQSECTEMANDSEYLGAVRIGNICFDIMDWGTKLWFDLYVGGVDTGYANSFRQGFEGYPYDYCDQYSFVWDIDVSKISYETFKAQVEQYIETHLVKYPSYTTDRKKIEVNLLEKANENLKLW